MKLRQKGKLKKLHATRLEYGIKDPTIGKCPTKEIPGSEFSVDCDMLILAMGFLGPVKKGMLDGLDIELDARGNLKTDDKYMTSISGIFAAGDARRGQSLIVWAIDEGRKAAAGVNKWLETQRIGSCGGAGLGARHARRFDP